MADSDGIDEAIEGSLRVTLTAAARIAEQLVRQRETELRRAEADSVQAAQEYRARLHAERTAARAIVRDVDRPQWWDTAGATDIARVYGAARELAGSDTDAASAERTILAQVERRHGIDVSTLPAPSPAESDLDRARDWARENDPEAWQRYDDDTFQCRHQRRPAAGRTRPDSHLAGIGRR